MENFLHPLISLISARLNSYYENSEDSVLLSKAKCRLCSALTLFSPDGVLHTSVNSNYTRGDVSTSAVQFNYFDTFKALMQIKVLPRIFYRFIFIQCKWVFHSISINSSVSCRVTSPIARTLID